MNCFKNSFNEPINIYIYIKYHINRFFLIYTRLENHWSCCFNVFNIKFNVLRSFFIFLIIIFRALKQ